MRMRAHTYILLRTRTYTKFEYYGSRHSGRVYVRTRVYVHACTYTYTCTHVNIKAKSNAYATSLHLQLQLNCIPPAAPPLH